MEGTMATIMLFAGDFAPKYWAYCNGQLVAISTNSALFSLLGTTFGGNGTTTFALPDFQGRTAVGTDNNNPLGQKLGAENITLNSSNLPPHIHAATAVLTATSAKPNTDETGNSILASTNMYAPGSNGSMGGLAPQQTGQAGSSQPFSIRQPYIGMNYVICMQGIYPSRS